MNLIQEWSHPSFIYLLILVMIGMLLYLRRHIWKQLRTYAVQATLSDTPLPSLKPFILRSTIAESAALLISVLPLILIPHTIPILTFALSLLLDIVLVIGAYFYEDSLIRRFGYVSEPVSQNLKLLTKQSLSKSYLARCIVFMTMLCLLILTLMGPEGPERNTHLRRIPIHSTILFDLSRSMNATDIKPSRLRAAQDEAISLLKKSRGDEIGLIYFTDSLLLQSPQTYDVESLSTFIAQVDPKMMPSHGTDLNKALLAALRTFDTNDDLFYLESNLDLRRVVLITDGETHTGDLDETIKLYKSRGIHIDIMAIGTQDGTHILDDEGNVMSYESTPVITKLQKGKLEHIAAETDGIYTEYDIPEHAADTLIARWDGARIDVNPARNMLTTSYRIPLYHYFLYPAFFLFCLFLLHPMIIAAIQKWRTRQVSVISNTTQQTAKRWNTENNAQLSMPGDKP